ncbi:MAG: hypothetical protein HY301_14195 [Verrucomicrobia bacterium]|nr:hypothetical protein [Verrucomicrobiota bacterium]
MKSKSTARRSAAASGGKIHHVVIYPFRQPRDYADLAHLYQLVARLNADPATYARPITVVDRKTHFANQSDRRYQQFRQRTVARHSDVLDAWCVDTCQMWYSGLGLALERGGARDVYWLIPGDFNYGSPAGREVLGRLHDLPEICLELKQDFCIGEIATDHNHPKQLIDTYGTFALLYNWFPTEAREIRQYTERPRSEFFAVRHDFLRETMCRRWFAYEQTVVMLLKAVIRGKRISRFNVGGICDLPQGRESLSAMMQQVERTERVLKTVWRGQNDTKPGWSARYRILEAQSDQVRRTALTLLENLLG